MRGELETLFRDLEPPEGGVADLRRRLRREPRRRRARLALAGAVAMAVTALVLAGRDDPRERLAAGGFDPALVSLGLQEPPSEPASIPPGMRDRMALQRVPLESDRVVFYYAAVLPAPEAGEAGAAEARRP